MVTIILSTSTAALIIYLAWKFNLDKHLAFLLALSIFLGGIIITLFDFIMSLKK